MPRSTGSRSPKHRAYLAVCAIFKDEAPYLREWIEFHRVVGVERFFLYNHASSDDHRGALAPYIEDGIVTLEDWQGESRPGEMSIQVDVYNDGLERYRNESRWLAFIDIDEFLFSPIVQTLPELLAEYEPWPSVAANWAVYGASGHLWKPPGLVMESYLWRSADPTLETTRYFKCIVDPQRVVRCIESHRFEYTEGVVVDERKQPIETHLTDRPRYNKLRINHYITKSEEEVARKFARPRVHDSRLMRGGEAPLEHLHDRLNDERDDDILRFLPAVKAALAEVDARAPYDSALAVATVPFGDRFAFDGGIVRYQEWGAAAFRCIEAAMASAERLLPQAASISIDRVLDFPCGRGRVLRVLRAAFPDAEITACDTDREAVDFCAEAFGATRLYADEDPANIETEATFDLIWCGSLFTHLAADRWPSFLEFLEWRLRAWGLLVFATSGRHVALHALAREGQPGLAAEMRPEYDEAGFSYRADPDGTGPGTALASPAWVCEQLDARPGLRLLTYSEQGWNHHQDVISCVRVGPRIAVAELLKEQPGITERELVEATGYDEPTVRHWLEALGGSAAVGETLP
jgi:SAM-dependent methyltransferase